MPSDYLARVPYHELTPCPSLAAPSGQGPAPRPGGRRSGDLRCRSRARPNPRRPLLISPRSAPEGALGPQQAPPAPSRRPLPAVTRGSARPLCRPLLRRPVEEPPFPEYTERGRPCGGGCGGQVSERRGRVPLPPAPPSPRAAPGPSSALLAGWVRALQPGRAGPRRCETLSWCGRAPKGAAGGAPDSLAGRGEGAPRRRGAPRSPQGARLGGRAAAAASRGAARGLSPRTVAAHRRQRGDGPVAAGTAEALRGTARLGAAERLRSTPPYPPLPPAPSRRRDPSAGSPAGTAPAGIPAHLPAK